MREIFTSRSNLLREFLTLGFLASAAAVIGIGSGLNSLFNSSSGSPQGSGASATTGAMNTVQPNDMTAYMKMLGINPSSYVNAGNQAGQQYGQQAGLDQMYQQMMQQQAGTSSGAQQNLMGAGNQMWSTVQNPQAGLYNQMLAQTNDTANASTAMRGIGVSPEAAGIQNQAVNQFNNAWNNNMVQNQATGLNAMTGAYNAAGNQGQLTGANLTGAANYGQQQATNTLQSGSVPFQTQQTAYGAPIAAGNQYSTGLNTALNPNLANYNLGAANYGANQSSAGMQSLLTGLNSFGGSSQPNWLQSAYGGSTQQPNYGGGTAADASAYYAGGGSVPG